jgi:DNA-nicking Smr family endonuclease
MDFGKILKDWEEIRRKEKRGKGYKKSAARDHLARWLQENPDFVPSGKQEKDRKGFSPGPGNLPIEAEIDLHGCSAAEAEKKLWAFLRESKRKGLRKVLIIHGKGQHSKTDPVLKKTVTRVLEKCTAAGRTGNPDRRKGGSGATWVLLRDKK